MIARIVVFLLLLSPCVPATAQDLSPRRDPGGMPVVRLATAEWPPYLGEKLPGQGALAALLRDALASQGYRLELVFFPWARTVLVAREPGAGFDGYFVEYFSEQVAHDYLLSQPVATSPLVLAERAGHPLAWQVQSDLAKFHLGVVAGYINTTEIDSRIARGDLRVEYAVDDAANARILAAGRIDAAVIDRRVLDWLQATDPVLRAAREPLRADPHLLEDKPLYACFARTPRGETLRDALDRGLQKINAHAEFEAYLQKQLAAAAR